MNRYSKFEFPDTEIVVESVIHTIENKRIRLNPPLRYVGTLILAMDNANKTIHSIRFVVYKHPEKYFGARHGDGNIELGTLKNKLFNTIDEAKTAVVNALKILDVYSCYWENDTEAFEQLHKKVLTEGEPLKCWTFKEVT